MIKEGCDPNGNNCKVFTCIQDFLVVHVCTFLMLMRVMQEVAKKPNRARGEHPNAASMIAESLAGH